MLVACPFTTGKLSSLEDGRLILCTGVQGHLALCCKATLPIMCMGHVRVITDNLSNERRLHQATRCLTKQPGDVSHLEVTWWGIYHNRKDWVGTRRLIDLRCAFALVRLLHVCCNMHELAPDLFVP